MRVYQIPSEPMNNPVFMQEFYRQNNLCNINLCRHLAKRLGKRGTITTAQILQDEIKVRLALKYFVEFCDKRRFSSDDRHPVRVDTIFQSYRRFRYNLDYTKLTCVFRLRKEDGYSRTPVEAFHNVEILGGVDCHLRFPGSSTRPPPDDLRISDDIAQTSNTVHLLLHNGSSILYIFDKAHFAGSWRSDPHAPGADLKNLWLQAGRTLLTFDGLIKVLCFGRVSGKLQSGLESGTDVVQEFPLFAEDFEKRSGKKTSRHGFQLVLNVVVQRRNRVVAGFDVISDTGQLSTSFTVSANVPKWSRAFTDGARNCLGVSK